MTLFPVEALGPFCRVAGCDGAPTMDSRWCAAHAPTGARARTTDPETSHLAAASVGTGLEPLIMEQFTAWGPMSDDQLVRCFPQLHGPSVRTARSRLTRAGRVVDLGRRGRSSRGREVIVWVLV